MLSFWPSLSLLTFFLVTFLECRVVGGRVTMRLSGFLAFFVYGCVGASLLSLLLQQLPLFEFGAAETARSDLTMSAAWLAGPPIEELAKALPVIVLAFFARAWRRLSIADLTLAGFASGAGFGFVENNLKALVSGTLPNFQHLSGFGFETAQSAAADYAIYFAGHPVYPALFGLAAGIGLRIFPARRATAWIPAALVFLMASFDHGMYNWAILHPQASGGEPFAAGLVEFLHLLTLHGRLETWLLPLGLIAAQLAESRLCGKALGKRSDLLLPREAGWWVINEWLVALSRLRLGRAAFVHTLAYFRRRRAFTLATLEAKRNPLDRALALHTRQLERRLMRERAILVAPPRGAWLPPRAGLGRDLKQWAWRMRWVLAFDVLFVLLFMLGQLPVWLREVLFGGVFTAIVVAVGLGFAVWRVVGFLRLPRLDPVVCEGAAYADYHARTLLLVASLVSGISPALSLLLGAKALLPGAAYISGYVAGWIHQGGNLHTMLGLGAMGGAMGADPGPAGGALRSDIAAGGERIRNLKKRIEEKTLLHLPPGARASSDRRLDEFIELMTELDAERDAQGQRKSALDEDEREAAELRVQDLSLAVQAVKDEFERLQEELNEVASEQRGLIAAFDEAYCGALAQIAQNLDAYDNSHRTLSEKRPGEAHEIATNAVESAAEPFVIASTPTEPEAEEAVRPLVDALAPAVAEEKRAAQEILAAANDMDPNLLACIGAPGWSADEPEIAGETHADRYGALLAGHQNEAPAIFVHREWLEAGGEHQKDKFALLLTIADVEFDEPLHAQLRELLNLPLPQVPEFQEEDIFDPQLLACIGAPGWSVDEIADEDNPKDRCGTVLASHEIEAALLCAYWEWVDADEMQPIRPRMLADAQLDESPHAQLQELLNLPPPEVPVPEQDDVVPHAAPATSSELPSLQGAAPAELHRTGASLSPAQVPVGDDKDRKLHDIYEKLLRVEAATLHTAGASEQQHQEESRPKGAISPDRLDKIDDTHVAHAAPAPAQARIDLPPQAPASRKKETSDTKKQARRPEPPKPERAAAAKTAKPAKAAAQAAVAAPSNISQLPIPPRSTEQRSQRDVSAPAPAVTPLFGVPRKRAETEDSATPAAKAAPVQAQIKKTAEPIPTHSKKSGAHDAGTIDTATSDSAPAKDNSQSPQSTPPRKSVLAEALLEYFGKSGETPPPMHTLDSESFAKTVDSGKLETARKGTRPWTYSGIPRHGDVAIRLKQGAENFVEFVPSNVTFGQTPRYYLRRVGVGEAQTFIPIEHLEYFDASARKWLPIERGQG